MHRGWNEQLDVKYSETEGGFCFVYAAGEKAISVGCRLSERVRPILLPFRKNLFPTDWWRRNSAHLAGPAITFGFYLLFVETMELLNRVR